MKLKTKVRLPGTVSVNLPFALVEVSLSVPFTTILTLALAFSFWTVSETLLACASSWSIPAQKKE